MRLSSAFNQVVKNNPDDIALTDFNSKVPVRLSFKRLSGLLQLVSDFFLRTLGTQSRVAILLPRNYEYIVTMMAAAFSERCYIPLSVDLAPDRLKCMLESTEPTLIAVDRNADHKILELLQSLGYQKLQEQFLTNLCFYYKAIVEDQDVTASSALILHTSGSTGAPKGILHSQFALESAVFWYIDYFKSKCGDRLLSTIPMHFDPAITDTFSTIIGGAELVMLSDSALADPAFVCEFIERENITVIDTVPTYLRFLLAYGSPERFEYKNLKKIYCGGEVLNVECARQITQRFSSAAFYNFCGPAEIICACFFEVPKNFFDVNPKTIPIAGRSYGVGSFAVTDEGEMLVTGEQLMIGYWKRPDLTSEKIVILNGQRWYKTGDIVQLCADGTLEYIGRRDRLVNRKAVRLELDDIEKNLYKIEGVHEVAVVAKPDPLQGCRVLAHVVLHKNSHLSSLALKEKAKAILSPEMMPDRFEFHESIAHTGMGKIDYQSLML